MSSGDNNFLNKIATLWVELGGDSIGVVWAWVDLRDKVAELEKENNSEQVNEQVNE